MAGYILGSPSHQSALPGIRSSPLYHGQSYPDAPARSPACVQDAEAEQRRSEAVEVLGGLLPGLGALLGFPRGLSPGRTPERAAASEAAGKTLNSAFGVVRKRGGGERFYGC